MKNKKGQSWGIGIITCIFLFLVGMAVINILKPEITTARIDLSCALPDSISSGNKILCLIVDFILIHFILAVFSVAGGSIVGRLKT